MARRTPQLPPVNFRMPPEERERVKRHAAARGESFGAFVRRAIAAALAADGTHPPPRPEAQASAA